MKNKIILLLVLLIPSLCFGRSVCINVKKFAGEEGKISVSVTDTKSGNRKVYYLKHKSDLIWNTDNKAELNKLDMRFLDIFGNFIFGDKAFLSDIGFIDAIELNAIWHDYQITHIHREYGIGNSKIVYDHSIYFYKPDK